MLRTFFGTNAAVYAALRVNMRQVVFQRDRLFGAILGANAAADTPHLTGRSHIFSFILGTAYHTKAALGRQNPNNLFRTFRDAKTAGDAFFLVHGGNTAFCGDCAKATDLFTGAVP